MESVVADIVLGGKPVVGGSPAVGIGSAPLAEWPAPARIPGRVRPNRRISARVPAAPAVAAEDIPARRGSVAWGAPWDTQAALVAEEAERERASA